MALSYETLVENPVAQCSLLLLATVIVAWLVRKLLRRSLCQAKKTVNPWDDCLFYALKTPLNFAVLLLGISFAISLPFSDQDLIVEYAFSARQYGLILLLAWFLIRGIRRSEKIYQNEVSANHKIDPTTAAALSRILGVCVVISTLLIILQMLGYSISGVLAFGGIGGIAVGFAAKDLLANFFGGLMIHLDRPFKVGDWIRSPDKSIEGVVEHIGWRITCIRTFDKRPLYVPNAIFTQIAVENPSRMTNRRIYETIGVRYQDADKLPQIVAETESMLRSHPDIDQNLVIIVNFDKFAESSLNFFIYTLTKTTDWVTYHSVKQDVLFKVLNIIRTHQAEIAFPTSSLHLESLPEAVSFQEINPLIKEEPKS